MAESLAVPLPSCEDHRFFCDRVFDVSMAAEVAAKLTAIETQEHSVKINMNDCVLSANPFSDRFAMPFSAAMTTVEDFTDSAAATSEPSSRIATWPDKKTPPILDTITPLSSWSSISSGSTLSLVSTAPTSPSTSVDADIPPIQWNNADLMYLLSILLPNDLLSNTLIFTPPLSTLDNLTTSTYRLALSLSRRTPSPPSPASFSKHAPIGTGRPTPHLHLLATSDPHCPSASAARTSLAHALLTNAPLVSAATDRYTFLSILHALPISTLHSIQRTLHLMSYISEQEWTERARQLCGYVKGVYVVGQGVGYDDSVEARLEVYFLEGGKEQVREWAVDVGVVVRLEEEEMRVWGRVYGDAVGFLNKAVEGVWEV